MAFIPLVPNWNDPVQDMREFLTTVWTSDDGTEQRVARRHSPRRTLSFSAAMLPARWQEIEGVLRRPVAAWHTIADFGCPDAVSISGDPFPAEIGTFSVSFVGTAPSWFVPGAAVALVDGYRVEAKTIASVSGSTVVFTTALANGYGAGARIWPQVDAEFVGDVEVTAVTSAVQIAPMSFRLRPGAQQEDYGTPPATYDSRELWTRRPNWVQSPSITYLQPVDHVDYGVGMVGRYAPVTVADRITQATYHMGSRADVAALLAFWGRCRGRRGEFYAPTWLDDTVLAEPVEAGATTVRVTAPRVSQRFPDLEVYRHIYLESMTHGPLIRTITSAIGGLTGSQLTLSEPLPAMAQGDVVAGYWLPLCRHAADALTVQWTTDEIASVTISPQAMRWRAAE